MPTRDRRCFVGQSIWYFRRQEYPHKELIILDDGEDCVADLIPTDERIRYVRLDRHLTVGAKRNLACEMSGGELIAHWDDDDWMAPDRLSVQVEQLLISGADVCGARHLLFYRPAAGEAWLYCYPHDARPWLAGGTLLYRRSAWAAHRFPEINIGEDNAFIWQLPPESVYAVSDSSFYVALIHSGNTSGKNLADSRWQKRLLNEISGLFALDSDFYAALRNGRAVPRARYQSFYAEPSQVSKERMHSRSDSLEICSGTSGDLPLVSCVMPTYNRRSFLPQAIEYFKRQDYPRRELIIVDDGAVPIRELIPQDSSIHYIHLRHKCSIGAKRNRACEVARGQIVILWDDDDWYAQDRISYQLAPLLAGYADITGLGNSLLYYLPTRQFWACTTQLHARMFYQGIVGGTLAFWKKLWGEKFVFPDISEREDAAFLETMMRRGARLEKLTNDGVFVYVRHETNTWQFTPGCFLDDSGWHQVAPPQFLPEQDCKFYGVRRQTAQLGKLRALELNESVQTTAEIKPLISCVLATGNRTLFLEQAFRCFLNQTYENKELIIIDDGSESAETLIPIDERIKYVRLESHVNLGRKLNIAIEKSRGEIIQKLDDDDYYHPRFLETTVNALVGHDPQKFIVGFDCFLVFIVITGELKFSGHGWCAGQTLCFFKQLWEKTPFRDVPSAADEWFLRDHALEQIKIEDPELFITVRHQAGHLWTNLGKFDVTEYFQRQPNYPKSLADCVSAEDLTFYEKLRQGFAQCETDKGIQTQVSVHHTTESNLTALHVAT